MSRKKCVIEIDEDGNCSIEGKGFVGPECHKFIGEIENDLGERVSSTNKPEYRQRVVRGQRERERN